MRPLDDWDVAYLDELAPMDETASLEKKSSLGFDARRGATKAEIAKQVCAFANSGEGFIAFGFKDKDKSGVGVDDGVPDKVGDQSVKDWVEGLIPKLHHPPIEGCEARSIQHPTHQPDRGVLVIAVPLSERRPHWTRDGEKAYLRVGAHSDEMRLQTLLDISSRGKASRGEVAELALTPYDDELYKGYGRFSFNLTPRVWIEGGPICESWAVELRVRGGKGRFQYFTVTHTTSRPIFTPMHDSKSPYDLSEEGVAFIRGMEPLFPHRLSRVLPREAGILLHLPNDTKSLEIRAIFFAGSAFPTKKDFGFDIKDGQPVQR